MPPPTSSPIRPTAALTWRQLATLWLGCGANALAGGPPGPLGPSGTTGTSAAAALADPTRPPAALMAASPGRSVAPASGASATTSGARSLAGAASAVSAVLAGLPTPVLQSLQLPLQGPAVAMVDGRLVKAGDTVGTRTVLSIDSQGLLLGGNGGTERLTLLGGPAKQAPGSITTTRTASFTPALALTADPPAQPERNPAGPPQPQAGGTLSLVGRIKP